VTVNLIDLDSVKMNQRARYLGQRSFSFNNYHPDAYTDKHNGLMLYPYLQSVGKNENCREIRDLKDSNRAYIASGEKS